MEERASIKRLRELLRLEKYKGVVNDDGSVVIPSSQIFTNLSNCMDATERLKPKYIYTILKLNRYNIHTEVLEHFGIIYEPPIKNDMSLDDSGCNKISFTVDITNIWKEICTEDVVYKFKNRGPRTVGTLKRGSWTNYLFEEIFKCTKIQCPLTFKRSKTSNSGYAITVNGHCPECDCQFNGYVVNEPSREDDSIQMECHIINYDSSFEHEKKRQLKGSKRVKVAEELVEGQVLPVIWRRKEADKLMDIGDKEPPHLFTGAVLRKAKQERQDHLLGIKSNNIYESLQQLKYSQKIEGGIHSIGLDPIYVHYWSNEQIAIYTQYHEVLYIDATGSLMKKARFQQKQMQEKEQKLLQLYNQQQQRAYHVVKRSSAGSTGSVSQQHSVTRTTTTTHTSNTPQGGKVRQMFDERRQTTVKGIDRSYPLEPLDNKSKRQTAIASNGHLPSKADKNSTVMRQTVTVKRTAKADINSNINGGKPIVSYQEEVSHQFFGNENHEGEFHNGEDSLTNQTGDNIEKILNDDTIEKNRMLAKIHLMEYDDNLRHRVNNDLNNEQFPEDLLVDVPDKLPRQPIARKLSPAEARLERFKNSNARKSKATVTTTVNHSELRKRSEPRSQSAKSISRVQKSPSPEPAGKKSTTSTTKTLIRRSIPSSPTRNTDIITTRGSASSKRPEPKAVRKSLQGVPKHHAVDTTDTISALEESSGMNATDTLDLENRSEFQSPADGKKSLTHSSTTSQKSMKVIDIDGNSSAKEPTAITKQTSKKISTELTSTTQNQRRSSPNTSPSPRPSSARSTASSTTSTVRGTSSAERESRPMATKTKNPTRSPGTTSTISTRGLPSVRNDSTALSSDALVACKACGRRFAQDRVSLHEKICAKTGQKKRKQFNAALHRVQGTELETFAKKSTPTGRQAEHRPKAKKPEPNTKSNWRRKHEDFINAIRSAKQVQAHLAAGGKLSDLPPPPASDTSDYIQCPHCSRKFNQSAAERHIPKCATMMHNKPNSRSLPKPKR